MIKLYRATLAALAIVFAALSFTSSVHWLLAVSVILVAAAIIPPD